MTEQNWFDLIQTLTRLPNSSFGYSSQPESPPMWEYSIAMLLGIIVIYVIVLGLCQRLTTACESLT